MCARVDFDLSNYDPAVLRMKTLFLEKFPGRPMPSGELTPGMELALLTAGAPKAELTLLFWGIPTRQKPVINARAETAAVKPLFAQHFSSRRCILPATGFFEWDEKRIKYRFCDVDGGILYLAGFYTPQAQFVLLTRPANASVAPVHARMPVLLRQKELLPWLSDPQYAAMRLLREGPPLSSRAL
jgi:putative SOS response-associated peptidase YedK